VFEPRSTTARRRSSARGAPLATLSPIGSTPLRPPSLSDADGAGLERSEQARAWPTAFDASYTVDRVWTDFVAAQPAPDTRTGLRQALAFARARHGDQVRRGSDTPYWVHLVRVAMEMARWGEDGLTTLQAALLHDTVEDTPTTLAELEAGFGHEVADMVGWLTAPPSEADIPAYYAHLQAAAPFRAQVLKIADRTDNLRSIQALVMRTGERHRRWAGNYLGRTVWQVLPLAAAAPSVARVALVTAMADLAPLVEEVTTPPEVPPDPEGQQAFTRP
jgi:guanosine-3',5'-bis(diphosphate) 3'-pyrophosphohydrolase